MIWFILSLMGATWWAWRRHNEQRRQRHLLRHPEAITDWERYVRAQLAIDEANAALLQQQLDRKDDPLTVRPADTVSAALKPEQVTERPGPEPVAKPSALPPQESPRLIGVHPDGRPRWSDE